MTYVLNLIVAFDLYFFHTIYLHTGLYSWPASACFNRDHLNELQFCSISKKHSNEVFFIGFFFIQETTYNSRKLKNSNHFDGVSKADLRLGRPYKRSGMLLFLPNNARALLRFLR